MGGDSQLEELETEIEKANVWPGHIGRDFIRLWISERSLYVDKYHQV